MKPNNYIMGIVVVLIIIIALGIIGYVVGYDFSSILAILSMLISIVAICATFIQNKHLSAQVVSMREQAGLTQNTTSYSLGFQMLQTFMQYPDLWPYFYENKKAESDISKEKSARIEAMALMILDYYEAIVCMNKYNELSKEEKAGWDKYFIEQIKKSPAIQAVYEKYKFSYRYTLKIPYEKAIKELK